MIFLPEQVPAIGEKVLINTSMSGHRYEIVRINETQCAQFVDDIPKGIFDYPKKSKNGAKRHECKWVVEGCYFGTTIQSYLAPLPAYYKCPIRRWAAENEYSQKMVEFATEFQYTEVWDDFEEGSAADSACGEKAVMSEDWIDQKAHIWGLDDPEWNTKSYAGGTVAVIARVLDRSTTTHRARTVTRFVVNPQRKTEALEWLESNRQSLSFYW